MELKRKRKNRMKESKRSYSDEMGLFFFLLKLGD